MTRRIGIVTATTAMVLLAARFAACGGGDAVDTAPGAQTPMADMATGTSAGGSVDEHADHGLVAVTEDDGQTIRYWTCVMHPSVRMEEPGTCPVCNMDLIPIYEGEGLTLTDRQRDLLPVRTEEVTFRTLEREIRTVGALEYNETTLAYASTRISGWIEDLMLDFTGIRVREGDELLTIYSPELVAAQEEYLAAARGVEALGSTHLVALQQTAERTVQAARQKLELYGLTSGQIETLDRDGVAKTELPLYAPVGGTVIHMNVAKGQHVMRGANLFRIADLSTLWIKADVYEYELPWLYMGQSVQISVESMPGQSFTGEVTYIYPFMDAPTRTQKVKIEVDNADGALRPGMYATIRLRPTLAEIYARETHPDEPYACPMHPWITSDHPTDCVICGMDLESTRPDMALTTAPQTMFVCPMHPDVQGSGPGECHICGMDLVETDVAIAATASTTVYTCPMHPDVQQSEPGECPLCGMDLVANEVEASTAAAAPVYTCPMHPDVRESEPGECPICGMDLIEAEADPHAGHDRATPAPARAVVRDTMARAPEPARGPALIFKYACPDHPEDYATVPGRCPKDGQPLVMTGEVLAVPKSAIIDTGLRKVVFRDRGDSGYEQVEVEVGPEAWAVDDGSGSTARRRYFPVITGLNPSDPVVTNGNFLLDSQTQLTGSASGAYGGALGGEEESSAPAHNH
jgi:membrane fusion protein, copper/silver efflux system